MFYAQLIDKALKKLGLQIRKSECKEDLIDTGETERPMGTPQQEEEFVGSNTNTQKMQTGKMSGGGRQMKND